MKHLLLLTLMVFFCDYLWAAKIRGNKLTLGSENSTDKEFVFNGDTKRGFRSNNTTNKLEFSHDGTTYKAIGSGSGAGGGENYNNGFGTDDNADAENGLTGWSASAGTFALNSSDPLEGTNSFEWTPSAQNDTLTGPVLSMAKDKFQGKSCEARIEYIGGDENLTLQVIDGNNDILASQSLPSHSVFGQESVFFLCPSASDISGDANKGNLRYRILNEGASASALIKFDKSYLGTLRGLSEVSMPDVLSAVLNANTSSVTSSNTSWIDSLSCSGGAVTVNFGGLGLINAPSVLALGNGAGSQVRLTSISPSSLTVNFQINTGANYDCSNLSFVSISILKQGLDAKQSAQVYKSIPKKVDIVNTLSGVLDFSDVEMDRQNATWVTGVVKNGVGDYTLNLDPTVDGLNLSCSCLTLGGINSFCQKETQTATQLTFLITNGSDNLRVDRDLNISCEKLGDTYKTPTVQPVIVGQTQNSYASSASKNVRVESCIASNNGTASMVNTLCNSWLNSVSRIAPGQVQYIFKTGTFSEKPVCTCSTVGGNATCSQISSSTTQVTFLSDNISGADTDLDQTIICQGIE